MADPEQAEGVPTALPDPSPAPSQPTAAASLQPLVLYTTSIATSSNIRSATSTLRLILGSKGRPYEEVDLALHPERREAMLKGSGGVKTLPQVHYDGRYIGDCQAVQALEDCKELDALIGIAPPATA